MSAAKHVAVLLSIDIVDIDDLAPYAVHGEHYVEQAHLCHADQSQMSASQIVLT